MKRYSAISIFAILLALVFTGNLALRRGNAETLSRPEAQATETVTRTVQVNGTGEVQTQPDTAVVSLGVQTEGDTAQAALNQNNTRMQSLLATLEEADIPARNIQTQTLRLAPRYEFNNDNRTLVGYTATNMVEVRLDNLDNLGTLLDQAVQDGANSIENIRFEVNNPVAVTDRARQSAFQNARHKAEQLADLVDTELGTVMDIRETSSIPGPVVRTQELAANAAAVPISPGSQTVTVEIQITWTLITGNQQ